METVLLAVAVLSFVSIGVAGVCDFIDDDPLSRSRAGVRIVVRGNVPHVVSWSSRPCQLAALGCAAIFAGTIVVLAVMAVR